MMTGYFKDCDFEDAQIQHQANTTDDGEVICATFKFGNDSPHVIIPINGIQQAINYGGYDIHIPVESAESLVPGMIIFIAEYQLQLIALETTRYGDVNGLFQRL